MSATHEFYTACAENSLREADLSSLDDVRARCLRAAAAWTALAVRATEVEASRQRRAAGEVTHV